MTTGENVINVGFQSNRLHKRHDYDRRGNPAALYEFHDAVGAVRQQDGARGQASALPAHAVRADHLQQDQAVHQPRRLRQHAQGGVQKVPGDARP